MSNNPHPTRKDPFAEEARAEIIVLECLAELKSATVEAITTACKLPPMKNFKILLAIILRINTKSFLVTNLLMPKKLAVTGSIS